MNVIPFGEVERDRFDICKKYGLIEMCGGIWRMTVKAKKNYEAVSFVYYLQGKKEKPDRIEEKKIEVKTKEKSKPLKEIKVENRQEIIQELFKL